jgi:hypothetical protein
MVVTAQKHQVPNSGADKPWYEPYYNVALEKGLITGNDFLMEKLNMPIARVEMAKISVRAAQSKWQKEEMVDGEALYESTKAGLLQGMDDQGALAPMAQTTRAQSVTVIERILTLNDGKVLPVDKYATSNAEIEWHKTNIYTMLPQYFLRDYLDKRDEFAASTLRFEAENGFSEVEKYIVIDLDDPNDPNRKLIPDSVKWRITGPIMEGKPGEWPTNAYALLSFNRLVVDSPVNVPMFRTAGIYVNYLGESEELKAEGKPYKVGQFGEYDPSRGAILYGAIPVKAGYNDIRYVTGNFIPKGELRVPSGERNRISLTNNLTYDLGQRRLDTIYTSLVDYSLSKE